MVSDLPVEAVLPRRVLERRVLLDAHLLTPYLRHVRISVGEAAGEGIREDSQKSQRAVIFKNL